MTEIYTLGTSNRKIEEFLEILKEYKIEVVIDVRRWPTSKLFPHFKKENLEKFLAENDIEYFHFEKLGGFREGGYEDYLKTKDFKEALKELIKIAKKKKLVVICAEKFPWKCHRAFIARELENKNFKIIHIIEKGRIWNPKKEPKEIKPLCQKYLKKGDNLELKEKEKEGKKLKN
jgi:uncharacterized protein (DUF488 family)